MDSRYTLLNMTEDNNNKKIMINFKKELHNTPDSRWIRIYPTQDDLQIWRCMMRYEDITDSIWRCMTVFGLRIGQIQSIFFEIFFFLSSHKHKLHYLQGNSKCWWSIKNPLYNYNDCDSLLRFNIHYIHLTKFYMKLKNLFDSIWQRERHNKNLSFDLRFDSIWQRETHNKNLTFDLRIFIHNYKLNFRFLP